MQVDRQGSSISPARRSARSADSDVGRLNIPGRGSALDGTCKTHKLLSTIFGSEGGAEAFAASDSVCFRRIIRNAVCSRTLMLIMSLLSLCAKSALEMPPLGPKLAHKVEGFGRFIARAGGRFGLPPELVGSHRQYASYSNSWTAVHRIQQLTVSNR